MLGENNLSELIQATSIKLNLSQFAVEKDFHVTKVIQTLTQMNDDYFSLVFQGGTSLSKGYQVIRRLSEDVDFRVVQKQAALSLGKAARRKKLRDFRYALAQALKGAGFHVPDKGIRVFYEGRFMSMQAEFLDAEKASYLKPHVAIECFLDGLALEPETREFTTLVKLTLGDKCEHTAFPVVCVALDETAAEKWVALTRRVANSQIKTRQSDKHLVRHLYDLYHLKTSGLLTGDYRNITHAIVEQDRSQFKKYNAAYEIDPIHVSELALDALCKESQWRDHWDHFLAQMVYEANKPSFDKAYGQLQQLSQEIFQELRHAQQQ